MGGVVVVVVVVVGVDTLSLDEIWACGTSKEDPEGGLEHVVFDDRLFES